ncbi:MAG: aromatic ring-hydroxylating dioxygenase subunit alpha [Candidatus Eremiobacteraeota bacterium]|nr:aromatic ring-hydroxylating dioxygenase subunit alpha [Candidatus Eremiobacteraeota bacterium]
MRTFERAQSPAGAKTLDAVWYTSAEIFADECRRILSRSWIAAGREAQIANAGDYFLLEIADESLIVTRDAAGQLHAFYNVCRHRGTRLCEQRSGHFRGTIQCPYHAWTYGLDGSLRVARNMEGSEGFDCADYPLREARIAVFEGFIFVCLDETAPSITQTFAPLDGRFSPWQLPALHAPTRIAYDVAANWKLIFQNYSECYHCPIIHPQLEKLSPSDSGRNDFAEGPFLGGYSRLRDGKALSTTGLSTRMPLGRISGEELERTYYYTIFPSLLLSLHPDYAMAHYVTPLAPDRTRIVCEWLFAQAEVDRPDFDGADVVEFWDLTNRQDWRVNELTQQGVSSRAYSPGPYAVQEGLLHAFDRYYLTLMA